MTGIGVRASTEKRNGQSSLDALTESGYCTRDVAQVHIHTDKPLFQVVLRDGTEKSYALTEEQVFRVSETMHGLKSNGSYILWCIANGSPLPEPHIEVEFDITDFHGDSAWRDMLLPNGLRVRKMDDDRIQVVNNGLWANAVISLHGITPEEAKGGIYAKVVAQ